MTPQRLLHQIQHGLDLLLILAVALMLGLGPFLHAHLRGSSVTGFHLDATTLPSLSVASAVPADHAVLTGGQDNESPAVGVASGYPARDAQARQAPDLSACIVLVFLLAGLLGLSARVPRAWSQLAPYRGFSRPGLPPPAQAPPFSLN